MTLLPAQHTFTGNDKNSIEALGYEINNAAHDSTEFVDFLQLNYPNFNLLHLLGLIEKVVIPTTTLPVIKIIDFHPSSGELLINVCNQYTSEVDAVVFQRTFRKEKAEILVYHDYFVLPATHRQLHLSKPIFLESLQQYINMGASKILVHAALSGGGYTWARYGFTISDKREVDQILHNARLKLFPGQISIIEIIYNHYYNNPDPVYNHQAFPVFL